MALARELGADLQRLPELLNARLASRAAAVPPAAAAVPAARAEDVRAPASRFQLHGGHLALGLGAVGTVLLLLLIPSLGRGGFRALAVILGVVGAFGVWRTTADWSWGAVKRLLVSGLALLPGLGFLACVAVLLLAVRAANA
jgi:hypothetical protein